MNNIKLKSVIESYKKQIINQEENEAIKERKERKEYYKSWTKERIEKMTQDEFVEYIGKLWSMIVWGNKIKWI